MTAVAFSMYDVDNLVPFAPFGAGGVLKGAVAAFFGFLGFDEVIVTVTAGLVVGPCFYTSPSISFSRVLIAILFVWSLLLFRAKLFVMVVVLLCTKRYVCVGRVLCFFFVIVVALGKLRIRVRMEI